MINNQKELGKALEKFAKISIIKLLKINIQNGTYEIISINDCEPTVSSPFLNDWVNIYLTQNHISPEYIEEFKQIVSEENLKRVYTTAKTVMNFRYKRTALENNDLRLSSITVFPSEEDNFAYLIVQDAKENYMFF